MLNRSLDIVVNYVRANRGRKACRPIRVHKKRKSKQVCLVPSCTRCCDTMSSSLTIVIGKTLRKQSQLSSTPSTHLHSRPDLPQPLLSSNPSRQAHTSSPSRTSMAERIGTSQRWQRRMVSRSPLLQASKSRLKHSSNRPRRSSSGSSHRPIPRSL